MVLVPESPKYLIGKGKYTEAGKVCETIAIANEVHGFKFNEEELIDFKGESKVVAVRLIGKKVNENVINQVKETMGEQGAIFFDTFKI